MPAKIFPNRAKCKREGEGGGVKSATDHSESTRGGPIAFRFRTANRHRQESAPVVSIDESICARASAELVLASPFISGFNQLSGIISLRPGDRPMGKFDARISRHRQRGGRFFRSSVVGPPSSSCGCSSWRLVLAAPRLAFASGEERTTVGDDLVIRTDTRWAGGTLGGYLPVRVEIANHDCGADAACSK